jgi:sporulation protein YlmC with PRC-barrel domain
LRLKKNRTHKIYILRNKPKLGVYLINFEKIIGLQVITSGAHILGEVKGARIDPKTWEIKYLNVKLADDAANRLGMKKRFRSSTISVPVSDVLAVAGVVTLNRSLEELESGKEIVESKE